jgi:hypothetical protein
MQAPCEKILPVVVLALIPIRQVAKAGVEALWQQKETADPIAITCTVSGLSNEGLGQALPQDAWTAATLRRRTARWRWAERRSRRGERSNIGALAGKLNSRAIAGHRGAHTVTELAVTRVGGLKVGKFKLYAGTAYA